MEGARDAVARAFPGEAVITGKQLREFLGVAPSTFTRMRESGRLPRGVLLPGGGDMRFLARDVADWLASRDLSDIVRKRGRPRKKSGPGPGAA